MPKHMIRSTEVVTSKKVSLNTLVEIEGKFLGMKGGKEDLR